MVAMLNDLGQGSCKGYLEEPGGLGLMVSFIPFKGEKEKVEKFIKTLYKNGLICYSAGRDPYKIRFLVPAIITDAEIAVAKNIIEQSIKEVSQGV
jgi:4-aminobutyrate aminotransferase-like enzyme